MKKLIKVSRQEADMIRTQFPSAHISIVNRGQPYKKYWAEENRDVMRLLRYLRGSMAKRTPQKAR